MALFTKESLERLRHRIDLQEVLSPYLDLKKAGASYKALCPFHDEKTPSFVLQRGDNHYHCFGCGAHGDAIQFLMEYQKYTFAEAVEALAERFNVPLEYVEQQEEKGVSRAFLREALESASLFFHTYLLHTEEGHRALHYLLKRGLSLEFIKRFEIGYAPQNIGVMRKVLHSRKMSDQVLAEAGLLTGDGKREFFRERITFPIKNPAGSIIGFSARKIREETFGGKYINTPETTLFKKSRLLFGLSYCRRRIAKERRAVIVEGQIDCLRLIEAGLNLTVATLGTAFGEGHIHELKHLGVREVTLLFDSDTAGYDAASKTGDLLQKVGIAVHVAKLPPGSDPDTFLSKYGPQKLLEELDRSSDYLTFQVSHLSKTLDAGTPAGKNELVKLLTKQIRSWDEPVMIHESLRKIAHLTGVPEDVIGVGGGYAKRAYTRTPSPLQFGKLDPNRILELDLLRWLVLMGQEKPTLFERARTYLTPDHFFVPLCRKLYESYLQQGPSDLLTLLLHVDEVEAQTVVDEILNKKINRDRAETHFDETLQKLLDRHWLQRREEIKLKIHSGNYSEEEVLTLAKEFDELPKPTLNKAK